MHEPQQLIFLRINMLRTIFAYFFLILSIITYSIFAGQNYGAMLCMLDGYHCQKVKRGDTWQKLFPDSTERDVVMRINRMNIQPYPGMMIAVPNDLEDTTNYMEFSPFPEYADTHGQKTVIVDLNKSAFAAYDDSGYLMHWGPASGGRGFCPDINRGCHTPKGTYYILSKGGAYCASTIYPIPYGGAPMPYCMYFYRGFALHGSYEVPGYNASHGCVRIYPADAKWLNQYFTDIGRGGTKIIIR